MTITIENEASKELPFDYKALIERVVMGCMDYEKCPYEAEVNVLLTNNEEIHKINKEYRGIDRATDVLSFPLFEGGDVEDAFDGEEYQLGDVVLSLERARAQSELYGHSFEREVAFLCVHSALHLMGYDHERGESDEQDMRRRQREILEKMGLGVDERREEKDKGQDPRLLRAYPAEQAGEAVP